jgi:Fic family protein
MPTIAQELDLIAQAIATNPQGIGMRALHQSLATPMALRTLQRRLSALLEAGRIKAEGGSRATLYKFVPLLLEYPKRAETTPLMARQTTQHYVPLSQAALEVRDLIRQPIMARKPVSYVRAFLERYRPNQDFYLTSAEKERLHELGRTSGDVRPAGTYARDVLGRLLIDLSWASSRLEGNTYSRLDTQRLLEEGQVADGKNAQETQMILNHKAAIEMLVENADETGFDRFTLLNLHALLSDNLMPDPMSCGRLRKRAVDISGSVYLPLAVPQQLDECFNLLLAKAAQIDDPFEQAFFAMVHLPYLQPFDDVNKRVSRLAANIPLIRHNLCPLSFVDVPDHAWIEGALAVYEINRTELLRDVFMWAYERSCQRYLTIRQSIGEPDAFRLKYRIALQQTVADIVRGKLPGSNAEIAALARPIIKESDVSAFVEAVQYELDYLYEGNFTRFRLRLGEFQAWPYKRADA